MTTTVQVIYTTLLAARLAAQKDQRFRRTKIIVLIYGKETKILPNIRVQRVNVLYFPQAAVGFTDRRENVQTNRRD